MSQISKKVMNQRIQTRIAELLSAGVVSCESSKEAVQLIDDLFTPTQKVTIAKRFSIAFMILEGYSYESIKSVLKVSTSTIGDVAQILNARGAGYRKVYEKIKAGEDKNKVWKEIVNTIGEYFIWASNPNKTIARNKIETAHLKDNKPF